MRNPDRIKPILDLIEKLWMFYPDWRFWQFMQNLAEMFRVASENAGKHIFDLWFVEDDEAQRILKMLVEQNEIYTGGKSDDNSDQ